MAEDHPLENVTDDPPAAGSRTPRRCRPLLVAALLSLFLAAITRILFAAGSDQDRVQRVDAVDVSGPEQVSPGPPYDQDWAPAHAHVKSLSSTSGYAKAFAPDGTVLLASGGEDGVRLWDTTDPAHPRPLGPPLEAQTGPVSSVAFAPDGTILASGGDDGAVRLWDTTDPAHPRPLGPPLEGQTGPVSSVAFAPDGTILASGPDGTVRLPAVR